MSHDLDLIMTSYLNPKPELGYVVMTLFQLSHLSQRSYDSWTWPRHDLDQVKGQRSKYIANLSYYTPLAADLIVGVK